MRRLASLVLVLCACGGAARFRAEHAGEGVAVVTPRGGLALPAQTIAIGQGAYDLHLHFDVPRAQVVEYTVACPGADSQGAVGEPFAAYRDRRLAQLRAQREQDRRNASAVTSALVGAFAPNAAASAQAGPVQVDAQVSPGAAAGAAVASSIDLNVQLSPGDVGGGPIETVVHLVTSAPGTCAVTAVADDANVLGRFEVVHIRDLEREAQERDVAAAASAEHARAALNAQLVAFGADTEFRAKQRATAAATQAAAAAAHAEVDQQLRAEANVRAERESAELRVRADTELAVRARAEAEVRAREARRMQLVLEIRARWRLLLISWGADINYRAKLELAAEGRARAAAELEARRLRYVLEIRARWRLILISWGADAEWRLHQQQLHERDELAARARLDAELAAREAAEARALDLSLRARMQMRSYLVMLGARERPPMPELRIENRGAVPFDGAAWIAGRWTWSGAAWIWNAGGWTDRSVAFGAAGGEAPIERAVVDQPAVVVEQPAVIVEQPMPSMPSVIVQTPVITVSQPTITVHAPVRVIRDVPARPVRDHRTAPAAKPSDPKVRDHRH